MRKIKIAAVTYPWQTLTFSVLKPNGTCYEEYRADLFSSLAEEDASELHPDGYMSVNTHIS